MAISSATRPSAYLAPLLGILLGMQIEVTQGDITTERTDAIVNAANSTLMGGGGVDGAIHAAAGPTLLHECRRLRGRRWPDGLPVGEAVVTGAGDLPAHWVIHTVGPNAHRGQNDPALLTSCFRRSLEVGAKVGARTISIPAISAGVYGWDAAEVADIAMLATRTFKHDHPDALDLVRFVLFSKEIFALFQSALPR